MQFRGGKKRPSDWYLDCAPYFEELFEKRLATERVTSFRELRELIVMEQFVNVAKEIVPLLREKRSSAQLCEQMIMCWCTSLCIGGLVGHLMGLVTLCLEVQQAPICQEVHVIIVASVISLGE